MTLQVFTLLQEVQTLWIIYLAHCSSEVYAFTSKYFCILETNNGMIRKVFAFTMNIMHKVTGGSL